MFHEDYIKDINKKIFGPKIVSIKDTKKGDTIIYRGGTHAKTGNIVTSKNFTVGSKYIASSDYRPVKDENERIWFKDHLGNHGENGHISVAKDDNGSANGWNTALFELIEKEAK